MTQQSNKATQPATPKKRILNEIEAKILNEENSDIVTQSRKVPNHDDMLFGCECDIKNCFETISISTQEYESLHRKNMHFMVVPQHVSLDIEEIITSFKNYCIVKKYFPQPRTL